METAMCSPKPVLPNDLAHDCTIFPSLLCSSVWSDELGK